MVNNENSPYTQFDSVTSGRIYRTKNGLTPMEKPNYVDPSKSASESTSNIFGGNKKEMKRYKLVLENNKKINCSSVYLFDNSLRNAKKRLIHKIQNKNNISLSGYKYMIETYQDGRLIKTNKYVFN